MRSTGGRHWCRPDDFEGPGYERVLTPVRTATGDVEAYIYVVSGGGDGPAGA